MVESLLNSSLEGQKGKKPLCFSIESIKVERNKRKYSNTKAAPLWGAAFVFLTAF
jgi:hypothetical protein